MLDRETVERLLQNNLDAKLNSELSKYGYQLDAAHKLFRFINLGRKGISLFIIYHHLLIEVMLRNR